jgi:hypothetical protein
MNSVDKQDFGRFLLLCLAFFGLFAINLYFFFSSGYSYSFIGFAFIFLLAVYLADFTSGILHFLVDFTPCKKGVGLDKLFYYEGKKGTDEYRKLRMEIMSKAGLFQHFVFFFKNHHLVSPANIARRKTFTTFLPTAPISLMYFTLCFILQILGLDNKYIVLLLLLTGIIVFFAQYFHACTHGKKDIPKLVLWLQKYGLILTVGKHMKHHKDPTKYFCFVNGWADGLVNKITEILIAKNIFSVSGLNPPERE